MLEPTPGHPPRNWFEFRDSNNKKCFAAVGGGRIAWSPVKRRDRDRLRFDFDAGADAVEAIGGLKRATVADIDRVRGLEWHSDHDRLELTHLRESDDKRKKLEFLFPSPEEAEAAARLIIDADPERFEVGRDTSDMWHAGRNAGVAAIVVMIFTIGLGWAGWAWDGEIEVNKRWPRKLRSLAKVANLCYEGVGVGGSVAIGLGLVALCLLWWWYRCQNRPVTIKAWRRETHQAELPAQPPPTTETPPA